MEKYYNVNNRRNMLQTEFCKHKSKKRSLYGMLKRKRTKVGFLSNTEDDVMTSRICSENKLRKCTRESSLHKSYISDSVINLTGAAEVEQYISSSEITNNKNQPLFCDLMKWSPSSTDLKNSGDGFDVKIQVLWCNEKYNSTYSNCYKNSEEGYSTPFYSSCIQSKLSNYSSWSPVRSEPSLKTIILSENSSVQNQSLLMLPERLSSSKSLPNCNLCPYCEAQTQFKDSQEENTILIGSKRKIRARKLSSPTFSMPPDIKTEDSLSSVRTHLIPTIKARERNFLYGRTAANSLLGSLELERTLPHRELRIFVGTWNMNGQIPHELNDFLLPPRVEHVPDMIVIGTQESFSEHFEWEVRMQETLGPSHLLFHSTFLGTLHLAVFMRRDLVWFCSVPEDANFCVRPASTFKTKGAVAIGFVIFGSSYLFITSHLTAHTENVQKRIEDVNRITMSLDLPKLIPLRHKSKDVTQNYDYVFWCGDLNFRLSQSREEILQWITKQEFPLSSPYSMNCDQLNRTILNGILFRGFQEGPITFPPTYKYDLGSQDFDTSNKQRTPAYTDRILYKRKGRGVLNCLDYTSVQNICTSDHKPVWGLYSSTVRPGIDTIPLAAGLFNREVYLEGIKRRTSGISCSENASTICSIQ